MDSKEASENSLQSNLKRREHLRRFFTKIFSEALYLPANSIRLNFVGHSGVLTICRGASEIKSTNFHGDWFDSMLNWLFERFLLGSRNFGATRPGSGATEFVSAIKLTDQILQFLVRVEIGSGEQGSRLLISNFEQLPFDTALKVCGLSEEAEVLFETALGIDSGLLIAAAPDADQLFYAAGPLLALSDLKLVNHESVSPVELAVLSRSEALLAAVIGSDCVDVLEAYLKTGANPVETNLAGIVCQASLPLLCSKCREPVATPDGLLDLQPAAIRSLVKQGFRSVGCVACEGTGRAGLTAVHSILEVDEEVNSLIENGAGSQSIADLAYMRGTRSLLDDALPKSGAGLIEIARFLELVPRTAPHFHKFAGKDFGAFMARVGAPVSASVGGSREGAMTAQRTDRRDDRPNGPEPSAKNAKPLLLVVEDDPDQRSILEMILRSAKYDVALANDGAEALSLVQKRRPDLIISDLMMPGIDGSELVRRLKSQKEYSSIPILVLTVIADVEKEFQLLELGADDYCEKSIQRKIFLKRVENLLKRSKAA